MKKTKEGSKNNTRDLLFKILSLSILVISGALFLSSALDYLFHFSQIEHFLQIKSHLGKFVFGISAIFAILNLCLGKHPFYEHWIILILGGITGIIYSF